MYKSRKRNWFQQWNFEAPIIWFCDWCKEHKTFCKKCFKLISAIIIGCYLSTILPGYISTAVAEYNDAKKIKAIKEAEYARHIKEVAEAERQRQCDLAWKAQHNKEYKEYLKQKEEQRLHDEMIIECANTYDWISITWWGSDGHWTGPDAPEGNSSTGQILKIVGTNVYGTWGDEILHYPHDVFHKCSKKDYLDIRQKEQTKRDRQNKKKEPFKSWGIYPGTVKLK